MKSRSFIKLPKYKRFSFEPRYYDPVKEDVENRERLIKGTYNKSNKAEEAKHRISDAFSSRQRDNRKPIVRQAIIAFAITVVMFITLYYVDKLY